MQDPTRDDHDRWPQVIALLTEAIERLQAAQQLASDCDAPPVVPLAIDELVRAKVARKECLQCATVYRKTGGLGLCVGCYNKTQGRLAKHPALSLRALIEAGLVKDKKAAIPRATKQARTALDEFVDTLPLPGLPSPDAVAQQLVQTTRPPRGSQKKR